LIEGEIQRKNEHKQNCSDRKKRETEKERKEGRKSNRDSHPYLLLGSAHSNAVLNIANETSTG
jgi:hypothetical protein